MRFTCAKVLVVVMISVAESILAAATAAPVTATAAAAVVVVVLVVVSNIIDVCVSEPILVLPCQVFAVRMPLECGDIWRKYVHIVFDFIEIRFKLRLCNHGINSN